MRLWILRVPRLELPDIGEADEIVERGEAVQRERRLGVAATGAVVGALQRLRHREETDGWVDRDLEPERDQLVPRQNRRAPAAVDDVGEHRHVERRADTSHLLAGLRTLDEKDVGSGLGVSLPPPKRLVETERGARIGARDDQKIGR